MISVVIPTRNRLAFLREAVASVLVQSFSDWELIVVDDCSQDGTWEWLESLGDGRIRPVRMERHLERSASRNAGLQAARGEYVLFLDDDDWLLEGALARLFETLQEHEGAIAAIGARVEKRPDHCRRVPHPRRRQRRDVWLDAIFGWTPQCGQMLLLRSAVVQAGGWRSRYIPAEDHDLWVSLSALGPVALIPEAVLGYRVHPGQSQVVSAASGTANAIRTIALRRSFVSGLVRSDRERGEHTVEALRHNWIAARAFRRGRYGIACLHCWRTVRQAPWLLASPISRPEIVSLALRSVTGILLGENTVRRLRHFKRAWAKTMRKGPGSRLPAEAGLEIDRREAP